MAIAVTRPPETKAAAPRERTCRHCGCTEHNACRKKGKPNCYWIAADVCSYCEGKTQPEKRRSWNTPHGHVDFREPVTYADALEASEFAAMAFARLKGDKP